MTNLMKSCSNEHFKQGYHYSEDEILDGDVLVEDDEGWGFFVTPSFGCVHFEERTANTKEGVALQPTTAPCCEGEAPHAETGTSA